jgi:gamma-glutamyl:cysteine ligase YbdK (ATP-grasp superfamily)
MNKIDDFKKLIKFNSGLAGHIGCEREFFLVDIATGKIVPMSDEFLRRANDEIRFSCELSKCQGEYKTSPCVDIQQLRREIICNQNFAEKIARDLGLRIVYMEVAPDDMPRDIYPDPRFFGFEKNKSDDQLLAMLQIASCHFHIGCGNYDQALKLYNAASRNMDDLLTWCDNSGGERIERYRIAAPNCDAVGFASIKEHHAHAKLHGYDKDLKDCYGLVRITKYGTVEFRMFGVPGSIEELVALAERVMSFARYYCPEIFF